MAWYLHPDEGHNQDGRHVSYLRDVDRWRGPDPEVFDYITSIADGPRLVSALQDAFEEGTLFASETVPARNLPRRLRCAERALWFERTRTALTDAEIIFADPDNGLVSDDPARRLEPNFAKRMPISEVLALANGRPTIVYHHNSRFKGGHEAEIDFWMRRLGRPSIAVRCNAYSCRTFLVINPDAKISDRVVGFCRDWRDHKVSLHANAAARSP
ncbi:hypothetical protein [Aurantimonas sp. VKM B-3413]|uniref:hypothetical protein n=1 Tax=Aurantimonas sp. VKM B-3413 TaxID=2779401 RepID=UPI001E375D0B|nr:hypothetical protein [Aurantimonas sp. VKM B-3413]MCB8839500.1 hypothetical protein [Aurantimonas sp. VKM B-3413]